MYNWIYTFMPIARSLLARTLKSAIYSGLSGIPKPSPYLGRTSSHWPVPSPHIPHLESNLKPLHCPSPPLPICPLPFPARPLLSSWLAPTTRVASVASQTQLTGQRSRRRTRALCRRRRTRARHRQTRSLPSAPPSATHVWTRAPLRAPRRPPSSTGVKSSRTGSSHECNRSAPSRFGYRPLPLRADCSCQPSRSSGPASSGFTEAYELFAKKIAPELS